LIARQARPVAGLRLSAVARRLRAAGLLVAAPEADPALSGISDDSRSVRAGELFCAWRGTAVDSHDYVPAAARTGAAAAVVEHPIESTPIPQLIVRDGRSAAALSAAVVFGEPQDAFTMAGITGTNGKTTSVWILRHLLAARWRTASLGTLGVVLEDGRLLEGSESLTTPGPIDLARVLRLIADRGIEAVAMEVSSHALDQKRVYALRFDVAVFTNLSRDHLDYHRTFEDYLAAKLSLADQLRGEGCAVINTRDAVWAGVRGRAAQVLSFGIGGDADVRATEIVPGDRGTRFTCVHAGRLVRAELPLLGLFNVENALGALAACVALGLDLADAAVRLATVPQVPGRLERILESPFLVVRDYAHTPDALERALRAVRPLARGRLIVVFGAGGDRDRGKRPLMGAVASAHADIAIVTSDNPRTEDPESIIDEIVVAIPETKRVRLADRRQAIAMALDVARVGDVVLLAGKGHESYQVIGSERVPFDERQIVEELRRAAPRLAP
jgi:UDP-N-acetylmuramoyl-L-alanyl-D-glutamate--2,6-diaminopimelate ligase